MKDSLLARWQANFWAGLAIVLPGVISVAVVLWLFRNVANLTDTLLIFLPRDLTHQDQGNGPMYWYWSLIALVLAVFLTGCVGLGARNYFGQRMIEWVESALLKVPFLNKIYSATKQVNEAFSANNKTAFRTVVLVEFPHPGAFAIGFVTSEPREEILAKTGRKMVCVFVPTTPIPRRLSPHGARRPRYEARDVGHRRHQIHRQPRFALAGAHVRAAAGFAGSRGTGAQELMTETATGLVLRTRPLTETSLIVQWLTPTLGRIATVAKGARRPKSPFRGKIDLFYLADLSFNRSQRSELHNLREVSLRETHAPLRGELGYLQQASYAAALIEQTTETETPIPAIFDLMSGFLAHLPAHAPAAQTLLAFELKLLEELGLKPDLEKSRLTPGARQIVASWERSDWPAVARIKPSAAQTTELREFLHGYLIFHLGKFPHGRAEALKS